MIPLRAPLITAGQLYLHGDLNEYMIVTQVRRGQVQYAGKGFHGHSEDQSFIERFEPVDPADVEPEEIQQLLNLCPPNTKPSTGFIAND